MIEHEASFYEEGRTCPVEDFLKTPATESEEKGILNDLLVGRERGTNALHLLQETEELSSMGIKGELRNKHL